jgi:hypothetical protein
MDGDATVSTPRAAYHKISNRLLTRKDGKPSQSEKFNTKFSSWLRGQVSLPPIAALPTRILDMWDHVVTCYSRPRVGARRGE